MNQTELNKSRIAEYNKAHVNDSAFSICDEWDESKHPRAANGQFGSGGASSAPTKGSKAPTKGNSTPAAEKPAQAKSTPATPEAAPRPKYWESVVNGANESLMQWSYGPTQKEKADPTIVATKFAKACMSNGSAVESTKRTDIDGKIHAYVKIDKKYKLEIKWDASKKRFTAEYAD